MSYIALYNASKANGKIYIYIRSLVLEKLNLELVFNS